MNKIGNFASILGLILAMIQIATGTFQLAVSGLILSMFFLLLMIFWLEKNSSKHFVRKETAMTSVLCLVASRNIS